VASEAQSVGSRGAVVRPNSRGGVASALARREQGGEEEREEACLFHNGAYRWSLCGLIVRCNGLCAVLHRALSAWLIVAQEWRQLYLKQSGTAAC